MRSRVALLAVVAHGVVLAAPASAAPPISALAPPGLTDLETHADDVTIDTERRELVLQGDVHVEASPFHLRSEALRLRRTARGIEIDGEGRLAFCPCLGTPLTLAFHDALVAPPSDLILRDPKLEIYGVPVLWLPYFWLRAPDRPGILPPDIAYRGRDGVFLGAGVHLPWRRSNPLALRESPAQVSALRELGLDVRGGAYLKGGYAIDADLRTPSSRTHARWDYLDSGGLSVDARGSQGERRGAAWDIDVVRGRRALVSTLSLDDAARPLDRARGEAFAREGPVSLATAAVVSARRGAEGFDEHWFGPLASAAISEAVGAFGSFDAGVRGGAFGRGGELTGAARPTLAFGTLDAHLAVGHPIGVVATAVDARGELGASSDGDVGARLASGRATAKLSLPLVRAYPSSDSADPWRHRLDPGLAANVAVDAREGGNAAAPGVAQAIVPTLAPFAAGTSGAVFVPEAGLSSALGRYGARDGIEAELAGGVAIGDTRAPVARARLAAGGEMVAASAEAGGRALHEPGVAVSSRLRIGPTDWLHVEGRAGGRAGVDPTLARLLAPSVREAPIAYFAAEGFSAGGTLVVPIGRSVTARGGTDFDLVTGTLLGARGSIDLRDGCGCVTLRLFGSHRLGREGVDAWLALELGESRAKIDPL